MLAAHLINNFQDQASDDERETRDYKEIERLKNIIKYIDDHLGSQVTLKEIAHQEQLSVSYLSHFISDKMGMSFQEYIKVLRLDKAMNLLLTTTETVTDIAYSSGFPSSKAFYKAFRDSRDSTPTEYREKYTSLNKNPERKDLGKNPNPTYLDVDRSRALEKLFTYLNPETNSAEKSEPENVLKSNLVIHSQEKGRAYIKYWEKLTTFGRAAEGLRHNWRLQLKELQEEIGFDYIRFHGIFSDEMMICNQDEQGQIIYNWSYVDDLFDFLLANKIKPFLGLSFMPSELKSSDETVFWWQANISRPKDIKLWNDLVVSLIKHCINRYGLAEVETWYFEVWNEPGFEYSFWIGDRYDYFEFYRETAQAVKSVSSRLKVGGPAIAQQSTSSDPWLEEFTNYCKENDLPLDFVSTHIYPEIYDVEQSNKVISQGLSEGKSAEEMGQGFFDDNRMYTGKNNTYEVIQEVNRIIDQTLPARPERHITEWNASASGRNLIHDTCFVATYIISNVIACLDEIDFLGYWTFTDIQKEFKAGISPFHGGFGLISKDGLKKPAYFAYYLLGKLGDHIIKRGQDYLMTKTGDHIQMIFCNYAYFDNLFLNGDTSALTYTDRYSIYEDKADKEIEVNISGLRGHYKVTRYTLNREYGSVYDQWVDMGAPENMTEEEINYLKGISYPKMEVAYMDLEDSYKEKLYIPVHGVELITLDKQI